MGYNKSDYVRIKSEFSNKYIIARENAQKRSMELHARFSRIREIDSVLARTGMDIMNAMGFKNSDAEIARIRERNDKLLCERADILTKNGYSADYSDVKYECEKCGDTGFVDTKMCECMKKALVLAGYESSGIGALIRSQTFDNFDLEYYRSGNYDSMRFFYSNLKSFAEGFSRDTYRNFLLIGGTGLGKTHMSSAIAKSVIDKGFDVLYVTSVGMIGDYEARRFGDANIGAGNDIFRYTDAELLIIDDLGTEISNQFTLSCIYDVINARINNRKCTIISTNLSSKEIETKYGERIYSRLLGEYAPILFSGVDVRKQKVSKK